MQKLKRGLAISGTSKRQDDTGFNDSSILACAECHRDLYGKTAYAISPASNLEQACCTGQLIESYQSRLACFQSSCHFSWSFLYELWSFLYDFMLFCCCLFTCPVCKLLVSVKPFSFVFRISLRRVVSLTHRENVLCLWKHSFPFLSLKASNHAMGEKDPADKRDAFSSGFWDRTRWNPSHESRDSQNASKSLRKRTEEGELHTMYLPLELMKHKARDEKQDGEEVSSRP